MKKNKVTSHTLASAGRSQVIGQIKNIIFFTFLLFTFYFCLVTSDSFAEDKMIAVVNNEVISQKDLSDFYNFMRIQYSRDYRGKQLEEKLSTIRQDLLQRLIEDRLILQEAKVNKVEVDASRLKEKISELKKKYPSEQAFHSELLRQGLVQADLENKIREQMLMFSIIEQRVRAKININPDEITDFYGQNKKDFLKPEERQLLTFTFENDSLAKGFAYNYKLNKKLEDLAVIYPFSFNKMSAYQGESLRPEIDAVVFKLGINEVSDPVKIDGQFYVFKLENIVASEQMSLAQAQGKIQAFLFEKKMQEGLTNWLNEIKKRSYIKIIEN